MPSPPIMPLTLGSVTFTALEVPGDLGLKFTEKLAVIDFPGGQRTAQDFGSFPPDSVTWTGHLFEDQIEQATSGVSPVPGGTGATFSRIAQLKQLRGQTLTLAFGPISFTCILHSFTPGIKFQWWVPYEITIIPLVDLSQGGAASGGSSSSASSPSATAANQQVQQATNSPASGAPLPAPVQQASATFTANVQQALMNAASNPANIPGPLVAGLTQQGLALQNLLGPIINGVDPAQASAAVDLSGFVSQLINTINPLPGDLAPNELIVNSADLYNLSAQYYGNASRWLYIAQANNLPPSPYLPVLTTGEYQLTIPPAPANWSALGPLFGGP